MKKDYNRNRRSSLRAEKAQWPRTSPVKSAISTLTAEPCTVPSLYIVWKTVFSPAMTLIRKKLKEQIKDIHISFQLNPDTGRPDTFLNGVNVEKKIRTMEVSSRVSPIAALDFVREAMVAQQQEMGKSKGIVMDGRDIGTTVFPDAELKIFVTASPEIRAQRRYDELKAKGEEVRFRRDPGECEATGLYRPEQGSESAPQKPTTHCCSTIAT